MLDKVKNIVGPRLGLAGLTLKEKQPEIMLVGGLSLGVFAAIKLAQAHKKSDETFHSLLEEMEVVRDGIDEYNEEAEENNEDPDNQPLPIVSSADRRRALMPFYVEVAKRGSILYGPSVIMGIGSVVLIVTSHTTMRNRNRALVAAATLIQKGFDEYRKRVRTELGEDADQRFYYGGEARTTNSVELVDGKKKKTKETKNHLPEKISPILYQRTFDETNWNWGPMDDMNEFFLRSTERYMNDQLQLKGWVLLNEAYKALGFESTAEGAVVGWSLRAPGDNFVSFGLDEDINMRETDNRYVLDFNVNGVVFDRIGEE